jgi:hypothetical protein
LVTALNPDNGYPGNRDQPGQHLKMRRIT